MTTPSYVYFIPAVFGVIIICSLGYWARTCTPSPNARKGRHDPIVEAKYSAGLSIATQKRLQEELFTDRGAPVWFSSDINKGRLGHWRLLMHDAKYEVRRVYRRPGQSEAALEAGIASSRGWTRVGGGQYEYRITPCKTDHARVMTSVAKFAEPRAVTRFTNGLIGWTQMSKYEIDTICASMLDGFGAYDLLWNNCQHFLRDFAALIISDRAQDFNLFLVNTSSTHHRSVSVPSGSLDRVASAAASLERMKTMRPHFEGLEKQHLEFNIRSWDMFLRKQKGEWATMTPVDMGDAKDSGSALGEREEEDEGSFDVSGMATGAMDLGRDVNGDDDGDDGGD